MTLIYQMLNSSLNKMKHKFTIIYDRGPKKNIQASNKRAKKNLDSYEIPDIK